MRERLGREYFKWLGRLKEASGHSSFKNHCPGSPACSSRTGYTAARCSGSFTSRWDIVHVATNCFQVCASLLHHPLPSSYPTPSSLKVGWRQDGLHVLHVVLYPRYKYDLPVLAMDLVVVPGGRVSLAIVDACPVSKNLSLPPHYMQV